ncbi:aspartate kinase, partial [Bifidobacteriaceae bacterium GH022]
PDKPGNAAKVFTTLAAADVNIDMIAQASASTETADISLTAPSSALDDVCKV